MFKRLEKAKHGKEVVVDAQLSWLAKIVMNWLGWDRPPMYGRSSYSCKGCASYALTAQRIAQRSLSSFEALEQAPILSRLSI